jgi:hypothetical protein
MLSNTEAKKRTAWVTVAGKRRGAACQFSDIGFPVEEIGSLHRACLYRSGGTTECAPIGAHGRDFRWIGSKVRKDAAAKVHVNSGRWLIEECTTTVRSFTALQHRAHCGEWNLPATRMPRLGRNCLQRHIPMNHSSHDLLMNAKRRHHQKWVDVITKVSVHIWECE